MADWSRGRPTQASCSGFSSTDNKSVVFAERASWRRPYANCGPPRGQRRLPGHWRPACSLGRSPAGGQPGLSGRRINGPACCLIASEFGAQPSGPSISARKSAARRRKEALINSAERAEAGCNGVAVAVAVVGATATRYDKDDDNSAGARGAHQRGAERALTWPIRRQAKAEAGEPISM